MTQVETIIAKAMSASKAWPAIFEAGSAAELARAAVAALDAAGFVVVPKEPSETMSVDGGLAIERSMFEDEDTLVFDGARKCYRAMIEARPK